MSRLRLHYPTATADMLLTLFATKEFFHWREYAARIGEQKARVRAEAERERQADRSRTRLLAQFERLNAKHCKALDMALAWSREVARLMGRSDGQLG